MFCIPKILKNESNSQRNRLVNIAHFSCFVSQRYWKMKAIHNTPPTFSLYLTVVLYPKDTEKWKQFTTQPFGYYSPFQLFCIPKILKNESNSQLVHEWRINTYGCFVSQRYWKMKAIHNATVWFVYPISVVLYPKDTEKWKQFTTRRQLFCYTQQLFCIPKILKNESNSQH